MGWPQSQNPPTLAITPPLAVADGGTGGASAAAARTNLSVPNVLTQRFEPAMAWTQANVAASQVDVALGIYGGAYPVVRWLPRRDGSITGITLLSDIVGAGDDLTVKVFVNGVASGAATVLNVGVSGAVASFAAGTYPYSAADALDVRVSTPVGWTALAANILVTIEVEG